MNCNFYTLIYRSPHDHQFRYENYLGDHFSSHLTKYGRISLFDPAAPSRTIIVKPCNILFIHLPLSVYRNYLFFNNLLFQLSSLYPPHKPIQELDFFNYPELFI